MFWLTFLTSTKRDKEAREGPGRKEPATIMRHQEHPPPNDLVRALSLYYPRSFAFALTYTFALYQLQAHTLLHTNFLTNLLILCKSMGQLATEPIWLASVCVIILFCFFASLFGFICAVEYKADASVEMAFKMRRLARRPG